MKVFLLLAFMLSAYSYAQSGYNHQGGTKKTDHHSGCTMAIIMVEWARWVECMAATTN